MNHQANFIIDHAKELGVTEAEIISTETIEVSTAVRWKCKYGCNDYGKRLTCPPHVPSISETKKLINEYNYALLLHGHNDPQMQDIVINLEKNYSLTVIIKL